MLAELTEGLQLSSGNELSGPNPVFCSMVMQIVAKSLLTTPIKLIQLQTERGAVQAATKSMATPVYGVISVGFACVHFMAFPCDILTDLTKPLRLVPNCWNTILNYLKS